MIKYKKMITVNKGEVDNGIDPGFSVTTQTGNYAAA
jgi:hypothetical protein